MEFEDSVERDASKVQTVDGTVHPLCAQTLSYLRRLFSYPNVEAVRVCLVLSSPLGYGYDGAPAVHVDAQPPASAVNHSAYLRRLSASPILKRCGPASKLQVVYLYPVFSKTPSFSQAHDLILLLELLEWQKCTPCLTIVAQLMSHTQMLFQAPFVCKHVLWSSPTGSF